MSSPSPRSVYDERIAQARAMLAAMGQKDDRIANLRLLVFLAAVVLSGVCYGLGLTFLWLLLPVAAFAGLVIYHDRVLKSRDRAQKQIGYYEQGVRRLENQWQQDGNQKLDFVPAEHLYAFDLDIFGEGSLFQLLNRARTGSGEHTLAAWLLSHSEHATILSRQAAVRELAGKIAFRELLALEGQEIENKVAPGVFAVWLRRAPRLVSRIPEPVLLGVSALGALSIVLSGVVASPAPALIMLTLSVFLLSFFKNDLMSLSGELAEPKRELALLKHLLEILEQERFESETARALQARLSEKSTGASHAIARLNRLIDYYDLQRNQFFMPFALILLWGYHVGKRLESWRTEYGPEVQVWLDVVGEFEALASLATYAYENPEAIYPELREGAPALHAVDLGHPLLPAGERVCNDVSLGKEHRVMVVSGSNMSGKSTYLRTIGINWVMGMAGAPVLATRFEASLIQIGATLRIQDSIQRGASRFYAELKKIQAVFERAQGNVPLLFLFDEILHGTNSHDRGIGATAMVKGLLKYNTIGLVTTHDLSLTGSIGALGEEVANFHFCDQWSPEGLSFDYRLRPGVVQSSNALNLMKSLGLPDA
ncbi:MAG: DNA mismatch repair protein MutS [Candidatus Hydrogenedentes bacterium]|nr:DNA mismatch repair protein MutS [Candidatus Hydrogenedentota bacterium]